MGKQARTSIREPDVFDILSAIWILSCNDENPIMTYRSIKYRLGLPENYDAKGLIESRGELFRKGVPQNRLVSGAKHLKSYRKGAKKGVLHQEVL